MRMRVVAFLIAVFLLGATVFSATKTVILPRGVSNLLSGFVFRWTRRIFDVLAHPRRTYDARDRVMALYGPVSLLLLPAVWVSLVLVSYALLFWAFGYGDLAEAVWVSGSSLLTLGFAPIETTGLRILAFSEATLGLGIVALLISFLPSLYANFSAREVQVAMMEVRAGTPPSAVVFIQRAFRIGWLDDLHETWLDWERWFATIEESHTSYPALNFFRSPQPQHSWITAAGAALDAAALFDSVVDRPRQPSSNIMIRAGYLALRRICDVFGIEYDDDPQPGDPIAITKEEFMAACAELQEAGVPLCSDLEQAWLDFAGWRVNYDTPLLRLAEILMAPTAPWSSDRSSPLPKRPVIRRWGRRQSA